MSTSLQQGPVTPDIVRQHAVGIGVDLTEAAARLAADTLNPALTRLATQTSALCFGSEPSDFLIEIERAKQR